MAKEQKEFLQVEPLNVENFIKVNKLQCITNPVFFDRNNAPTSDGLLSNEIFGISKDDRSNIFAYIDLHEYFINPIFYDILNKLNNKISLLTHGIGAYKIKNGEIIADDDGETGIEFLMKNFDKIKWEESDSLERNTNIKFIKKYKDRIFINKFLVIPAFYRDISTTDKYVGVGDVNKLYNSLLIYANSIAEYDKYGLNIKDTIKGKIQDKMVEIFQYFTRDTVSGKFGILKRAATSKTVDYSARLVIAAPNLKVENISDMMVDLDHVALPLAAAITNFYPYIISYCRNFFANNAQNHPTEIIKDKKGKDVVIRKKDYRIAFSDEVIKEYIDKFIHGFSDRFMPIRFPAEDNSLHINNLLGSFTGRTIDKKDIEKYRLGEFGAEEIPPEVQMKIIDRPMCWCDLFYMAAVESTRDKTILVTRYPIDSCYNQFPSKINIASTHETEPMFINNTFYKFYPKITKEDIGTNSSNKFIDTLSMSNIYLGSIGGDYDGDQVNAKSIFSIEANKELSDQINSKRHYISLSGKNIMETTNEGAMVLYSLTATVDDNKVFTDPEF